MDAVYKCQILHRMMSRARKNLSEVGSTTKNDALINHIPLVIQISVITNKFRGRNVLESGTATAKVDHAGRSKWRSE